MKIIFIFMFIFVKNKGSWASKLLVILFVFSIFPLISFAGIDLIALLPNPTGDDTLGEYIDIRNTGCDAVDISGYRIFDASNKTYVFPSSTIIASHENIRLPYSMTRIVLNNSGNESVTISDSSGTIIDSYEYSGTQRDNIVILISSTDENCTIIPPIITDTGAETDSGITNTRILDSGSTNSGVIATGSLTENNSGGLNIGTTESGNIIVVVPGTGAINGSGVNISEPDIINTGSTNIEIIEDSGSLSTGSIDTSDMILENISGTGLYNSGISNTGIIFPDVQPTIQYPTNALFSSGIFDCTGQSPCRINISFESIFTGGLLSKNYNCEIITETGSSNTCNPNTLYFLTGSSISFRLTSIIEINQSITKSWNIIYTSSNSASRSIINSGSISESTSENISSGITNTGLINSRIIFPDIIPIFQNYTNTTNSGDILTCNTTPCRVNFTLDPIFTGSFFTQDYTCEIRYGTGVYNSCNPPQLYPTGTGNIEIILSHKSSGEKQRKSIQIIQNSTSQNLQENIINNPSIIDTSPPIAIIEFDGKLKSYHEQIGDHEMNCYAFTCTINLTAEKSYDESGGKISFLWFYGLGDIKTTKDPGERKYGLGDHQIWLRVIDASGNISQIRYYIHVLGERKKSIEKITEKKSKLKNSTLKKESKKIKKIKKIKKTIFFDSPNIILQNSKFVEQNNRYICYTNSKKCSLNLTLSGSQKDIIYTWIYEDGESVISKNPKSRLFNPGVHTIRLIAGYSSDTPLWSKEIGITVIKTKKPKKIKKAKISKIVHMSGSKNDTEAKKSILIGTEIEEKNNDTIPYTAFALISGIMPIIILRRVITGIKWKI